jgi:NTP pyrophosphatase (non-canonical NTP hydrolase)
MKLNDYFDKAMTTNKEASDNITYSVMGLTAEVGEIADKIAKWRRKGIANIDNNRLVFTTANEVEAAYYRQELAKEVGDVLWFVAHLSRQLGYTLDDVAKMNIEKLRDRAMRNVIIGEGDNR